MRLVTPQQAHDAIRRHTTDRVYAFVLEDNTKAVRVSSIDLNKMQLRYLNQASNLLETVNFFETTIFIIKTNKR